MGEYKWPLSPFQVRQVYLALCRICRRSSFMGKGSPCRRVFLIKPQIPAMGWLSKNLLNTVCYPSTCALISGKHDTDHLPKAGMVSMLLACCVHILSLCLDLHESH